VPEVVIVQGRVCVENDNVDVVEGFGRFLQTPTYPPHVYDGILGRNVVEEDDTRFWHHDLDTEIPDIVPLPRYLAKREEQLSGLE